MTTKIANKFRKVEFKNDGNGGGHDMIGDTELQDGKMVEIQFPDGTIKRVRVKINLRHCQESSHNCRWTSHTYTAHFSFSIHGKRFLLPLAGMRAR